MAKLALSNAKVTLNSVDLSAWVKSITLNMGADEVDVSTMSSTAWKTFLSGLKEWSADITFTEDYAASAPNVSLFSLVGSTSVTLLVVPVNATVTATNPEFEGSVLVLGYSPVNGQVGQAAEAPVRLRGTGALARNES